MELEYVYNHLNSIILAVDFSLSFVLHLFLLALEMICLCSV